MSGVNTRATKRDSDRDVRESQHSSTPHPFASTDSAQLSLGATGSSSPLINISQGLPQLQPLASSSSQTYAAAPWANAGDVKCAAKDKNLSAACWFIF